MKGLSHDGMVRAERPDSVIVLSDDDKAAIRRRLRMERVDRMAPEIRALVHEHGLTIIDAFLGCDVIKPKQIQHLIATVREGSQEIGKRVEKLQISHGAHRDALAIVPVEPTDEMISAGLAVTAAWLDIKGSSLTVNREKMRRRYRAMVRAAQKAVI